MCRTAGWTSKRRVGAVLHKDSRDAFKTQRNYGKVVKSWILQIGLYYRQVQAVVIQAAVAQSGHQRRQTAGSRPALTLKLLLLSDGGSETSLKKSLADIILLNVKLLKGIKKILLLSHFPKSFIFLFFLIIASSP